MHEKVIQRIFEIRYPEAMPQYRAELRKYKRRLGKRQEGKITENRRPGKTDHGIGFLAEHLGQTIAVVRPKKPEPTAWCYSEGFEFMGSYNRAEQLGLLADPLFNREIRPQRVEQYTQEMLAGRWHDLLSDPIAITRDGQVVNGQHRIAAACRIKWDEADNDPAFLVVWGVDPREALYADGSRRTDKDEKAIAYKIADGASA
jgi:hypothetical protein